MIVFRNNSIWVKKCSQKIHYRSIHSTTQKVSNSSSSANPNPNPNSAQDFEEIPGPFRLPIVGNLYLYKLGIYSIFDYHKVLIKFYEKYGPIVREDIGQRTIIHIFDPDDVKLVHGSEGRTPIVPPLQETTQLYRQKRDLSLGLGNTNGEEWYRLRSAVQQMMLRPKEVSHYLPQVDQVAQDFVKKIEKSINSDRILQDMRILVAKWSLESAGMICFDRRLGCFDQNEHLAQEMIQANKDIFIIGGVLKFSLPIFKYISTPKWRKFLKAEDFFYSNATKFVTQTLDKINDLMAQGQLQDSQFNFMNYLLSRKELTQKDVTIITLSLFGDGLSTTTPSMMYNLYCLAKNPQVQAKLYEEIHKVVQPPETNISVDILNKLQLLKACVKETFRLYPIGTEVSRNTSEDLVLSGYKVPKGTHVDLNQSVHFLSEKYFTKPKSFRPERWLRDSDESNSLSKHPYLLIPFGHGTRMCAGRRYAEQDLYVTLTRIVQKYKLELVQPTDDMEQVYNTLLFPKNPVKIRFVLR